MSARLGRSPIRKGPPWRSIEEPSWLSTSSKSARCSRLWPLPILQENPRPGKACMLLHVRLCVHARICSTIARMYACMCMCEQSAQAYTHACLIIACICSVSKLQNLSLQCAGPHLLQSLGLRTQRDCMAPASAPPSLPFSAGPGEPEMGPQRFYLSRQ